jgi:hypothetical protein
LYSWQAGSNWNYAVLEGTTTVRPLKQIQTPKNRLKGISYLKGRIAGLPAGETLYWREDKSRGLRLPSKEMILEINQFAKASHIRLLLPGQTTASKASEEIESDFDRLVED